jgi:hypothetical protein
MQRKTEQFIVLIQREKFDYTKWRQNLFVGMSGEEISKEAMEFQTSKKKSPDLLKRDTSKLMCEHISSSRECLLASEDVLRRDWERPEEDEAWANL